MNLLFRNVFNVFDIIVILMVSSAMVNYSYWWALAYIPATLVSVIMNRATETKVWLL